MSEEIASQSEETQEEEIQEKDQSIEAFRDALGLMGEESDEEEEPGNKDETEPPAKEEEESPKEPKGLKVKFNKEDRFVDDKDVPDLVEKGLALDKYRSRSDEYQKHLDRAAKLAGFDNHEDFISNMDSLEEASQKREQDQYTQLRQDLIQEGEEAGLDGNKLQQWLDNNPLLNQAKAELQKAQEREQADQQSKVQQEWTEKWNSLYEKYPDTADSAKLFGDGQTPEWYTQEMAARVDKGYDPIDAYELAHRDKIMEAERKKERQQALKDQRFQKRAQVESESEGDLDPEVPEPIASAFDLFGLSKKSARKYAKKG